MLSFLFAHRPLRMCTTDCAGLGAIDLTDDVDAESCAAATAAATPPGAFASGGTGGWHGGGSTGGRRSGGYQLRPRQRRASARSPQPGASPPPHLQQSLARAPHNACNANNVRPDMATAFSALVEMLVGLTLIKTEAQSPGCWPAL